MSERACSRVVSEYTGIHFEGVMEGSVVCNFA